MKSSKLVCGIGFNDQKYAALLNGKPTKHYNLWKSILNRCYSQKYHEKQPTYIGCYVSDNFLNYSYFYEWANKQIGFGEIDANGRHWQIDKDILISDNKLYHEDVCVFIPQEVNTFFTDRCNHRGEWPVGVCFIKQRCKFMAHCSVNGKQKNLGYFNAYEEAFSVYKAFKEQLCKELAANMRGQIDERVYDAMMVWEV